MNNFKFLHFFTDKIHSKIKLNILFYFFGLYKFKDPDTYIKFIIQMLSRLYLRYFSSWIGITIFPTVFSKFFRFLFFYYINILPFKNKNKLGRILTRIQFIVDLKFFHNWIKSNSQKNFKTLCLCNRETFLSSKKFLFSNFKLFSLNIQESTIKMNQFNESIDLFYKLTFFNITFINPRFKLPLNNFFGVNLYTHSNFPYNKYNMFLNIIKPLNKTVFRQLILLGIINQYNYNQKKKNLNSWKQEKIATNEKIFSNLTFSRIFKAVMYNSKITI
nr:hypothetical protein 1634Bnrm3_p146 [Cryptomonas sp.]